MRFTAVRFIHAGTPYQPVRSPEVNANPRAEGSNKVLNLSTCDMIRLLDIYNKAMQELTGVLSYC